MKGLLCLLRDLAVTLFFSYFISQIILMIICMFNISTVYQDEKRQNAGALGELQAGESAGPALHTVRPLGSHHAPSHGKGEAGTLSGSGKSWLVSCKLYVGCTVYRRHVSFHRMVVCNPPLIPAY